MPPKRAPDRRQRTAMRRPGPTSMRCVEFLSYIFELPGGELLRVDVAVMNAVEWKLEWHTAII